MILKLRAPHMRFINAYRWARGVGGSLKVSIWYAWKMARMKIDDTPATAMAYSANDGGTEYG